LKNPGPPRTRRILAQTLLVCAAVVLLVAGGCRNAGRFLVVDLPPEAADAIVVLAGARAERWLEAVDLYRENVAPRIVLSPGILETAEVRVREMGVRFPAEAELAKDAMAQIGVPAAAIIVLAGPVDNTADEAVQVRAIASLRGWTRLIVVTSKYHSRRARYAFERELEDTAITVRVRGSRYDVVHPDRWWQHRSEKRFVISELQKLIAYRLGLDR
jgi:uncharacterized SAM-binding protein YcdF (DUF218 family)